MAHRAPTCSSFLAIVLLTAAMLATSFTGGDLGIPPGPNKGVMQKALTRALDARDMGEDVEILARFVDGPTDVDRAEVGMLGFRTIRTFDFINAIGLRGPKEAVLRLSNYDRTAWIEYNLPLQYMMNGTTTAINATTVWNSKLYYGPGDLADPIDGTGVTAVVLDSGVDAGHPDLDYKEKVIMNLKSDSDNGWIETENSDTSSGHGTHCAGTIAGNGDASQGARRGVAPGASLIGLSTGEAVAILNAVGAIEWVYDHTKPYNNPYNIRVVSNSWGTNAEYDPNDAINVGTRKTLLENNVVFAFAAGNEGGDGTTNVVNPYSLEPGVVSVAAMAHDGGGIASFSSRGDKTRNETWPDLGAPGVKIWATEARDTLITLMRKQDPADRSDGYYMAISGTSMATPHMSGVLSLLWEAAPSMRMSDEEEEYTNKSVYGDNNETSLHEAEVILKLTAEYVSPPGEGVPTDVNATGLDGKPLDFAQGYGMVNVRSAVALALTLENLRHNDTSYTVWDAYKVYKHIEVFNNTTVKTNKLMATWEGDWSWLNDGSQSVFTSFPHKVFIPNGTGKVQVDLSYRTAESTYWGVGELNVNIDFGDDGSIDFTGDSSYSNRGSKNFEVDAGGGGAVWAFYVEGMAVQIPDWWNHIKPGENQYREMMMEYSVGIQLTLDVPEGEVIEVPDQDLHAGWAQLDFAEPDSNYTGGGITLQTYYFDMTQAYVRPDTDVETTPAKAFPLWIVAVLIVLAAVLASFKKWSKFFHGASRMGRHR